MLGLAIVLLLVGVGLSLRDMLMPKPPRPPRTVLVATTDIDTYTVLRPEMVERREVAAELAPEDAYGEIGEKRVLITTRPIKEGEVITRDAAVAVGSSWRPATMDLEVLSFPADFDKMVAGQVKPGHKINIYGYHVGEEGEGPPVTLVAHDVWVVDARTASGTEAQAMTPEPAEGGGPLGLRGLTGTKAAPASIVTVAVEPEVAWKIIEALGAQRYRAWVTLSGSVPPPLPTPTPTPPMPPVLQVTPQVLVFSAQEGEANPASQQVSIANAGSGALNWTVTKDVDWLTVNPASGIAPSNVNVSVDIAGLSPDTYEGQITIDAGAGTQNSPQTITAVLAVAPAPPPITTATPTPKRPVIHVILVNWMLDIVSPKDLKLVPVGERDLTFDYVGRELTMKVRNGQEIKLWAERQDQDARALVSIDGQKGRVWFKPGQEGTIKIQLAEGADEATVVLVDAGG